MPTVPDHGAASPPLRGGERINDELEVGFNPRFEVHWYRFAIAGRILLAVIVAAGLAGVLGSGPLSHHRTTIPAGAIAAVDFEPVARFGTPTQITFHLRPGAGDLTQTPGGPPARRVMLTLSTAFVEPFGLQSTSPTPLDARAHSGNVVFTILTADSGQDGLIRVIGKPSRVGPLHLTARAGTDAPVRFTQYILP